MKSLYLLCLIIILSTTAISQNSTITLKDLAVPASPVFVLLDASPSVIQTPGTPKAFVMGIAQSFQQSGGSFPQEYSAEFTPYWMIRPGSKSIYKLTGIQQGGSSGNQKKQRVFSGIQFTTLSTGFFNKDLIPDDIDFPTKIVAIGIHSNLLKIQGKYYADSMHKLLVQWHNLAQSEMDENMELFTEISRHPERAEELQSQFVPSRTSATVNDINALINQKPIFSWDLSAAYAGFGIGDSTWATGRMGVWSSVSSYITLTKPGQGKGSHYLSIHGSLRYIDDQYTLAEDGGLARSQYFDAGGKILFDTDKISIGFETVRRFKGEKETAQFRTVGLVSYQVGPTIYVNAAFGKNFDFPGKLIALFGINLGFGSEKVNLQ